MTHLKRTALIYDYDGTLAHGNIQENSFIPSIDMTREEFWAEVKRLTKQHDADEILIYMQLCCVRRTRRNSRLHERPYVHMASPHNSLNGLDDKSWFERLNVFAADRGLALEHYILSSGTQEMIEGSLIAGAFKAIYASRYIYNENGEAEWPSLAINYTTKTQFLFRINKGINNVWDNKAINTFMPETERPIPFTRMVFIGDGDTDIPAMKMTSHYGGHSIAAYDPKRDPHSLWKIHTLISDGRVNFVAPADYTENAAMDILMKGILGRIARAEGYRPE